MLEPAGELGLRQGSLLVLIEVCLLLLHLPVAEDELLGCLCSLGGARVRHCCHLGMVDLVALVGCACRCHLIHCHSTTSVEGGVGAAGSLHGYRCRAAGEDVQDVIAVVLLPSRRMLLQFTSCVTGERAGSNRANH